MKKFRWKARMSWFHAWNQMELSRSYDSMHGIVTMIHELGSKFSIGGLSIFQIRKQKDPSKCSGTNAILREMSQLTQPKSYCGIDRSTSFLC